MSNEVPRGERMICVTREQFALLQRAWDAYRVEFNLGDGYGIEDKDLSNAVIDLRRKISEKNYQALALAPPLGWLEACPLDFSGCKAKMGLCSACAKGGERNG